MEEDQDVPPPPSPVVSDVTYESDTPESLEHAMITEVTSTEVVPTELASTYEVGKSSADPRVVSSVIGDELSRLREEVTWCQGRYMSRTRSTSYRPSTVIELMKEKKEGKKVAGKLQVGLYRQSARMSPVE